MDGFLDIVRVYRCLAVLAPAVRLHAEVGAAEVVRAAPRLVDEAVAQGVLADECLRRLAVALGECLRVARRVLAQFLRVAQALLPPAEPPAESVGHFRC